MATLRLVLLLLLPLALAYKYDKKVASIQEKLKLQKHISNSIDHGPAYKSSAKGLSHTGAGHGHGLLGHRGEQRWKNFSHKNKLSFGHKGEHHQPANTRYDNDDITLQRLDIAQDHLAKKSQKIRKPKTSKQMKKKKYQTQKMYRKLYKEKSKKKKYQKHQKP